ncbi:MAG: signal recognition particle-docking protein FtsY [Bacillota bacterium]
MTKEFMSRLMGGWSKVRDNLSSRLAEVLGNDRLDDDFYDELEAVLVQADVGVNTAMELIEELRNRVRQEHVREADGVRRILKAQIRAILEEGHDPELHLPEGLGVVMFVGVNGVGKTTTIGKLASQYRQRGQQVILAAGDTFRAAAAEQLAIWSERAGARIIRHDPGADPAAVAFDALQAARARQAGVVLVDTAGRLHTKHNLMEELRKMKRVIARELPGAPHETLLVIDANTGLNGLEQARAFLEAVEVTGIVLTKLDSTAKGGVVVAIKRQFGLPVKLVGLGEGIDDLAPFEPAGFVEAILG